MCKVGGGLKHLPLLDPTNCLQEGLHPIAAAFQKHLRSESYEYVSPLMYLACFRLCCDGSPDHYLILIFESMMYVDTPTALRDFAARLETCLGN